MTRSRDGAVSGTVHLGIDVGTSVTKAALFDDLGDVAAVAARPTRLEHPCDGCVEQDVDEVVRSVADVVAKVRAAAGGAEPAVVAITGQGDGCWLVDEDGAAVRPAVSWMDGRAGSLLSRWEREGVVEAVYRENGNVLFPGAQALVLRWLEEHERVSLDRAATAAYCKDVVVQRLTGLRATDASDASLPFSDPAGGGYSIDALRLCGLEHRDHLLAPIVRPLPMAPVSPAGADASGLPECTPIVGGPFDLPACAAGAGVAELGDGLLIVGTTLGCQVLVDRLDLDGEPAGMHLATPAPDRWLRVMAAMVGCASLNWVLQLAGLQHGDIDGALQRSRPGAGGVEMLPYLAPSGERAPFVDPTACGQLTGLRLTTTRDDLVRAVCEGIAYAARDCFEAAGLSGRLFVCGGGSRSRPWRQIFADVLNRPLYLARSPEVGARGAVLTALEITDRAPDRATWTHPEAVIEPDPPAVALYEEGFRRYRAHRAAAQPLWRPV